MLYSCIVLFILFSSALAETIEITVSGGSFSDPDGLYYTLNPVPNQFIKGNTYKFTANGISPYHPFTVGTGYKSNSGLENIENYSPTSGLTTGSFTIKIPDGFTGSSILYFCTAHSSMRKSIPVASPAPSNAKCDTHTCPSGHVLRTNPETISCASATCGDTATDDDTCCEPGYSFGLADINLCPDDSPVNIVWAGEHNIQESVSHDCDSAKISGPLEFDGSTTLNGDVGFLPATSRRSISANLLSDWKSGCTAAAPCKILALHGGGGSANSMQTQMNSLAASLGNAFTFVYASIGAANVPETWWADPLNKATPTTSETHAAAMVTALDTIRINQGPFWGIVGYSQGAAAVPVYLSNVPDGTFQAAAMFAGYLTTTHEGLEDKVDDKAPFGDIPALIWLSTVDPIIDKDLSRDLVPKFTNPTKIEDASAGHVVPKSGHPTFNEVAEWFRTTAAATPRVRYFRCSQHCSGARLRVKCNRESPNAKCDTHTCPSGHVLKETSENIPCAGTTCASPTDDDTCCESGYSFGLADINLCPDDPDVNIVWEGTHNIQESVSHDCDSAVISEPLSFDGSTSLNGDVGFLGAGSRKNIAANLLSDWNSTRYFRCSQHCSGARLSVTCNRAKPLGYCAADYAALGRVYDPSVPECPHGAAPIHVSDTLPSSLNGQTYMCRCGKCGEIFESMVQIREACVDGVLSEVPGCNGVSPQPASSCDDCADGLYYVPDHGLCTGCTGNGAIITADVAETLNPPVELCPSTPEVSAASCDTLTCPALFSSKSSASSIDCAAEVCTQQSDLYTCCESTVEPFNRVRPVGIKYCYDSDCRTIDGADSECVNAESKVTAQCLCKNNYNEDIIIANVGDWCESDGLWSDTLVTNTEDFGYVKPVITKHKSAASRTLECHKSCETEFANEPNYIRGDPKFGLKFCKQNKCALCGKCLKSTGESDFAYIPPRVQSGNQATGSCFTYCEKNFMGTFSSTSKAKTGLQTKIDAMITNGELAASDEDEYRKDRVCTWAVCGGCKACFSRADSRQWAGKAPLVDGAGDGSRYTGGCSWWCQRNFEGLDGMKNGLKNQVDALKINGVDATTAEKEEWRKNKVARWARCSGCKAIKDWQSDASADFREIQPEEDYSGQKYSRRSSKKWGKCDFEICPGQWAAASTPDEKEEVCATFECNGCSKCKKYMQEISARQSSDSMNQRASKATKKTIEDMKVNGAQVELTIRGIKRVKGGCAGYPICRERKQETDCKKIHCEGCDFC